MDLTQQPKKLSQLLTELEAVELQGEAGVEVRGLTTDSRRVEPGWLFAALPGQRSDGHSFVAQAVERGASAVLVSEPIRGVRPPAVVLVDDVAASLARLAGAFTDHPSRQLELIGITGTNGKTTLTYLLEAIFARAGRRPGIIGTVDIRYGDRTEHSPHTTPQAPELHALLRRMVAARADVAAMEVSSHALALQRVRGVHFRAAVFTNLSRDHLDFHGDLERYAAAKALLFERELRESRAADRLAVINIDDAHARQVVAGWDGRTVRYGLSGRGDVFPTGQPRWGLDGIRAQLHTPAGPVAVHSALIGRHNLENLTAAAAVAWALGTPAEAIAAGLQDCQRIPGRLERVVGPIDCPAVFVDYAHTDQALVNVLATLGPLTRGRLLVVFGCGGDRDRGKRPLMAEAVAHGAGLAVVTSDNPRTEDPLAIIAEVVPGLTGQGWHRLEPAALRDAAQAFCIEPDRRAAIRLALAVARPEDVVLVAGKGHETYQLLGDRVLDFDDRLEARRALELRAGGAVE